MVRESDPIRGSSEDPTPEETTDTNRTAKYINQLRNRLRRLEENRATRSDLGGGFADPEAILSPISRVVDRGTSADLVTVTTQAGASSSVIDDFEDDDVAEYSDPNNAMQTLSYPVDEGDHALRVDSSSDGTRQNGISSSGLPYYPSDGDTFRYRAYVMPSSRAIMLFGSDGSADNSYEIALDSSTDEAIATLVDGGSSSTLLSIDVGTLPTAVWIEVEVMWSPGGGFTVEVFDENGSSLGSDTTTDSTYVSGGVGWGVAASGLLGQQKSAYFDFARTTASSSVIDDAEDADISEYSGDTGSASVKNSVQIPVYHGAYAIELDGQATIYAPQGNLNNDAVDGDSFASHHYAVTGSVVRFLFGVQDGSNYYYVEADEPSGTLSVSVVSGGSSTPLGSSSVAVPTDEWVEIAIDWGSAGSIDAELFAADGTSQGTVSVSDSTYTNGGHGWAENGSVTSYHDYALVTTGAGQVAGPTIVDDFEDDSLSEYNIYNTNANTVVTTSPAVVHGGSYALEMKGEYTGTRPRMVSMSGLDHYPTPPTDFELYLYNTEYGNVTGTAWCVQSSTGIFQNHYNVFFSNQVEPSMGLTKYSGGAIDALDIVPLPGHYLDEWIRIAVSHETNGDIFVEAYDSAGNLIGDLKGNDSEFSSGGVGVFHDNNDAPDLGADNGPTYVDDWKAGAQSVSGTTPSVIGDLVAWVPLNAGAGGDSGDVSSAESGDTNGASINGASWSADAKTGGHSLAFNGSGNHLNFGDDNAFTPDNISVMAWVKPDSFRTGSGSPESMVFATDDDTAGRAYTFGFGDGSGDNVGDNPQSFVNAPTSTVATSTTSIPTGSWVHLAMTYDGSEVRLYVNGTLDSTSSASGAIPDTGGETWAGGRTYSGSEDYLDGHLDDIRVYHRGLSGSEIQTIYNNTV